MTCILNITRANIPEMLKSFQQLFISLLDVVEELPDRPCMLGQFAIRNVKSIQTALTFISPCASSSTFITLLNVCKSSFAHLHIGNLHSSVGDVDPR